MAISAMVMGLLLAVGLSVFTYLMLPRIRILVSLKSDDRFDQIPTRIHSVIKFAIGQWRMPREPIAGFMHIFIFSGFLVVALGTIQHFVQAFIPRWVPPGFDGLAGDIYNCIKDIFEYLVLVGVSYGLWRRLKPTPSRVGRSIEGVFVLVMIFMLMVTDFLIFGAQLILDGHSSGLPWHPGGALGMVILSPLSQHDVVLAEQIAYWMHCTGVLVFLNFLPLGKHFHVITGIPNVFFRDLQPYGQIEKLDFETEAESYGMRSSADLTWKMALDLYSCTECARCTVYCPTALTDKPLTHIQLNLDLKEAVYAEKKAIIADSQSDKDSLPDLVGGRILADTVWACTTCGSCEQECPVFIENVPRIIQMRQHKVMMEGDISPELARAYKGMETNSNPWGIGADKRDAWAEGLDVKRIADYVANADLTDAEPPMLYWVGCAGSFDERTKKVTIAMVKILQAAEVPFVILGKEEGCTGDTARRTGNEYLFQELVAHNVEILTKYGVKKILTHCPHCLHTIKREYPQFGGNYEVVHHTELIEQLLADNKLSVKEDGDNQQRVAWHDSCYLGRYHDIYDAPRKVIERLPSTDLVELPRNKSRSVCCGAGGGRFWMEERIGERINVHRAKEIAKTNPQVAGTSCPFCLTMVHDGLNDIGAEAVVTQDLAEIVAASLS